MPAPRKAMLSRLTKLNFAAKQIQLPTQWRQPGNQYPDAFSPRERMVAPTPPLNLFREATLNKYHVDSARTIGKQFEKYIDGVSGAICKGIGEWMRTATVVGVVIGGPVGVVRPGCLLGPPLMPLILKSAPKKTPQEQKYSRAIAGAFGSAWQGWHLGVTGVMAFPGLPMAPCPNVPMPLIALPSVGEALLSPKALQASMMAQLGEPTALHAPALFDAIAQSFFITFQTFKATTLVMNVIGTVAVGNGPPGCIR